MPSLTELPSRVQESLGRLRRFAARAGSTSRRTSRRFGRRGGADAPRPLAFLHVPKSAGSSIVSSLHSGLGDHRWAPWEFDDSLMGPFRGVPANPELAPRILPDTGSFADHDAAAGHFSLPTLLDRFDPSDVALVVREPRARLLSLYEYWRHLDPAVHEAHLPWTSSQTAVELEWEEWLDDPSIAFQTDNVLIRHLVPDDPAIPPLDFIDNDQLRRLARRAEAAVRRLGWVGLVELGAETWASLGTRVGVPLAEKRLNVTDPGSAHPTAVSSLFTEASVRSLAARTAGDRLVWTSIARRLRVDNPELLADVAWTKRLGGAARRGEGHPGTAHTDATSSDDRSGTP